MFWLSAKRIPSRLSWQWAITEGATYLGSCYRRLETLTGRTRLRSEMVVSFGRSTLRDTIACRMRFMIWRAITSLRSSRTLPNFHSYSQA